VRIHARAHQLVDRDAVTAGLADEVGDHAGGGHHLERRGHRRGHTEQKDGGNTQGDRHKCSVCYMLNYRLPSLLSKLFAIPICLATRPEPLQLKFSFAVL
jgi:hypothetical protein